MRAKLQRVRYWGPFTIGCVCLFVSVYVPPFVSYVLIIVAFALLFEVGTAWFQRAGRTGGLKDFHQ
jgi:hypothetical protein